MEAMRFRFDGQPINETDTPSQVRYIYKKGSEIIHQCISYLAVNQMVDEETSK